VGYLGDYLIFKGKNQLFINEGNDENGVPKFVDRAMEFGLDLIGFATQAAFFDFDRDGDLDMFMLNHSLHENGPLAHLQNFALNRIHWQAINFFEMTTDNLLKLQNQLVSWIMLLGMGWALLLAMSTWTGGRIFT
jgi:hypothetical protein